MPRVRYMRRGTGLPCPLHALPSQYVQLLGSPQTLSVSVFYGGLVALGINNLPARAGDMRCGFDPWVGKIPLKKEMGSPLQYPCLKNPMDRGAWQATVQGVAKSRT